MNDHAEQKVSDIVGRFCKNRVPLSAQDQIKMFYRIKGNDVIIFESRPYWQDNSIWTEMPIAKIKHLPDDHTWQLFWQRANGRWVKYPDFSPSNNLDELVKEIDSDPHCVFWG